MIFSIQRFLDDYFQSRGLRDIDQYAVNLANVYDIERIGKTEESFLKVLRRIRTAFYRTNKTLVRAEFEKQLLAALDSRFKKKVNSASSGFPGGVETEQKLLGREARRTITSVLNTFKLAVESRAIDSFWKSRKKRQLQSKPESIGQSLLAVFAKGVLSERGLVQREVGSGIGFVDIVLIFGPVAHLVELKIMKAKYTGVAQLDKYMRDESRPEGWLILFDGRRNDRRPPIPERLTVPSGIVKIVVIDINPEPPSSLDA